MMRTQTILGMVLLVVATAATPATAASPSPAASPYAVRDGEPWIVFEAGVPEVHGVGNRLIRPDGSDEHWATPDAPITSDPGGQGGGGGDGWQLHPDWSPDGSQLAFAVDTWPDPDFTRDLWVSDADGSNTRQVYDCVAPCFFAEWPAWSDDGSSLLFVRWDHDDSGTPGSQLQLLDLASGDVTTLAATTGAEYFLYPRWSPDGRSVVAEIDTYTDISDSASQVGSSIAIVDLTSDPGRVTKLTGPDVWAEYPDWHPSQDLIVYTARPTDDPGKPKALFTMRPDGSRDHLLAKDAYSLTQPTWLPDGSGIILVRIKGDDLGTATMVTVTADGTDLSSATSDHPRFGTHPRMRPLPGD